MKETASEQQATLTKEQRNCFNRWLQQNPGKSVNEWLQERQKVLEERNTAHQPHIAVVAVGGVVVIDPTLEEKNSIREELNKIKI